MTVHPAHADSRPLHAAAWMTGALLCFSTMAVAGREASHELDTFEIMTYRSLIGLVVVLVALQLMGGLRQVRVARLKLHVARNIAHFTGQNLWFFAVATIPLSQVFAYEFTSPIWLALLAPFVLGEPLTRARLLAALLGFIGIVIVARPGNLVFGWGELAAASTAIAFACTTMTTKLLSRTESTGSILLMMTGLQAVFGLVCAGIDGDMALPGPQAAPFVVLVALAGLSAHFCVTRALGCAPATLVAPMEFMRLPLIAVVGLMLYGEGIDLWVLVGGAVAFSANLINVRAERRRRAPVTAESAG